MIDDYLEAKDSRIAHLTSKPITRDRRQSPELLVTSHRPSLMSVRHPFLVRNLSAKTVTHVSHNRAPMGPVIAIPAIAPKSSPGVAFHTSPTTYAGCK